MHVQMLQLGVTAVQVQLVTVHVGIRVKQKVVTQPLLHPVDDGQTPTVLGLPLPLSAKSWLCGVSAKLAARNASPTLLRNQEIRLYERVMGTSFEIRLNRPRPPAGSLVCTNLLIASWPH